MSLTYLGCLYSNDNTYSIRSYTDEGTGLPLAKNEKNDQYFWFFNIFIGHS